MQKYITTLYLASLGISTGIIIAVAISAGVIFGADNYLPPGTLSQFQSGVLMTEIFVRTNSILTATAAFIILYELYSFRYLGRNDFLTLGLALVTAGSLLLFTLYYTPMIVEAQQLGEAMLQDPDFGANHKASELVYKIALFALAALLLRRIFIPVCKAP